MYCRLLPDGENFVAFLGKARVLKGKKEYRPRLEENELDLAPTGEKDSVNGLKVAGSAVDVYHQDTIFNYLYGKKDSRRHFEIILIIFLENRI